MNKMITNTQERVLCIPAQLVGDIGIEEGFTVGYHNNLLLSFLKAGNYKFVDRDKAEEDCSLKQIIPYILVVANKTILRYVRGKAEGEVRLHGRRTVGVGGHINSSDSLNGQGGGLPAFLNCMTRELNEELGLSEISLPAYPVGYINDNTTPVGKVHLGVVYALHDAAVDLRRCTLQQPEWIPTNKIGIFDEYEVWSQHCLQHIDLLTCRRAEVEPGKFTSVQVVRKASLPGFFECLDKNNRKIIVPRQSLVA